jgi:hypothetical protein
MRAQVEAMLSPTSLAIIGATLVAWAGSHCLGIGGIVDIILLVVGFSMLGVSVLEGAQELMAIPDSAAGNSSKCWIFKVEPARAGRPPGEGQPSGYGSEAGDAHPRCPREFRLSGIR